MEKANGPKTNTFGSSVSFDLDLPGQPKRRRKRGQRRKPQVKKELKARVECPGCGHDLPEDEWIDALVGFVSGARAFDVGDPVQSRVVQTLRNTVSNMELPQPRDVWELSIVARLMVEFESMIEDELHRRMVDEELYTAEEVRAYGQQIQAEALAHAEAQQNEHVRQEILAELEPALRREIEHELWKQFDEELNRRLGES